MFGAYPQNFWLLYIIEACYFFPFRFYLDWIHTPKKIFYAFDYCWVMNLCLFFLIITLMFIGMNPNIESGIERVVIWRLIFGTACGPLLAATLVMPLPLIFHNNDVMSSIFIHFFPAATAYIFRWNYEAIVNDWKIKVYAPQIINLFEMQGESFWPSSDVPFTLSIFGLMFIQYMTWFILYSTWQLLHGIKLGAGQKFDTCFHANMRDGMCLVFGKYLWKRSDEESQRMVDNDDYELRDFAVYMLLHFTGVMGAIITLAWTCNVSKAFHLVMLMVGMIVIIIRGAIFYNNIVPELYYQVLEEMVENEVSNYIISGKKKSTQGAEGDDEEEMKVAKSVMSGDLGDVDEEGKEEEVKPLASNV